MSHYVVYDPQGTFQANLPLEREPHMSLVKAVLAWTSTSEALEPHDYEQIALQLTNHARAVASVLESRCAELPEESEKRPLAEVVLAEAQTQLAGPLKGTARCVQDRARALRALYARLDRLDGAPAPPPPAAPA